MPTYVQLATIQRQEFAMKKIVLGMALAFVGTRTSAQVTSMEAPNPARKSGDLNRIVCEREETTGTRLGAKRVCLTVAQWDDKRREHREHTEKVQQGQNQRPNN